MHPLKQLRRLIQTRVPNQGKVVGVDRDLRIATATGLLSVTRSATDATRYRVGDTVLLSNGQVVGKRLANPPTYVL